MKKVTKAQKFRQSSFGFLIQLLGNRIEKRMVMQLEEIGLDLKMFASLMMLLEKDGITQRELGRLVDFPEYSTSRNIDVLEKAGFVERRPNPKSRRSHLIYLTTAGRQKAAQLPAIVTDNNKETLKKFSKEEKKQVIKLLQKAADIPEGGDPHL